MAMVATKKGGGSFTPCPAGQHHAVVVDVTPLQKRQTNYGLKEQFRIVFETETINPENKKRFCIWSQWLSLSLHEKAGLRKLVKGILDRDLTKAEEDGFDVESLLGKSTQVMITHDHVEDSVFARIGGFIKAAHEVKPSGDYKRTIDRDQTASGTTKTPDLPNENPRCAFTGDESWKGILVHVGKNQGELVANLGAEQVFSLLNNWWPSVKEPNEKDKALHEALIKGRDVIDNITY